MRRLLVILAALACWHPCTGGDDERNRRETTSGPVTLTFWHGYTDYEADSLNALLDQWNAENPDITIDRCSSTTTRRCRSSRWPCRASRGHHVPVRVVAPAARGGARPGRSPNGSRAPRSTGRTSSRALRDAATFEGKVLGVPALINLAVVYNKTLFDEAGLEYPNADWTWDDFRAAGRRSPIRRRSSSASPIRWTPRLRLALRPAPVAERRLDPERGQHPGGVQLARGRRGARGPHGDGRRGRVGVPRPAELAVHGAVQQREDRDARDRPWDLSSFPTSTTASRSCPVSTATTRRSPVPTCGPCSTTGTGVRRRRSTSSRG